MSRAREVSKVISTVENLDAVAYSSASPSGAGVGDLWVDTSTANPLIKAYDGNEWDTLGSTPVPIITGIAPDNISGSASTAVIINGTNFESGSIVKLINTSGTELFTLSTTFNNARSLQFLTPALTASAGPYDVKVINPDNQMSILENVLTVGQSPIWQTSSGTLGNIYNNSLSSFSFSLLATDPDNSQISYTISSGTLPPGLSLTSGGSITGTAIAVSSDTTYSFTVTASDGVNNSNRDFSITIKAPIVQTYTTPGTYTFTAPLNVTSVQYLVVAGGGGGGGGNNNNRGGGGGGAGGYLNSNLSVTPTQNYSIVVGAGGSGGGGQGNGSQGGNSQFSNITSVGGGFGSRASDGAVAPGSGGSGGGGGDCGGGSTGGGAATAGQGNAGGNGNNSGGGGGGGGSGGGAFSAGLAGVTGIGGTQRAGGSGIANSITGTSVVYATGGNGGAQSGSISGQSGAANSGNGGAGGSGPDSRPGGNGGSGIVVIRY